MGSVFSLAQESAEYDESLIEFQDGKPVNQIEDQEAAQEILSETHTEGNHFDSLCDGQDKVYDLKEEVETVLESGGLSPKGLMYLQMSLRHIVGKRHAARKLPSMESANITHPVHLTAIALEGIKETLVEFWTAIKNQLGKFWKMTKDWYIKTFDVANGIIKRAKVLGEKANTVASSPTEKSFTMSGVDTLSVNYQVKDPAVCITGYENLKKLIDSVLVNVTSQNQNDKSDSILTAVNSALSMVRSNLTKAAGSTPTPNMFSDEGIGKAVMSAYEGDAPNYGDTVSGFQGDSSEMAKKLGIDPNTTKFEVSQPLPGNRTFFLMKPIADLSNASLTTPEAAYQFLDNVKLFRMTFADTAAKPKTMEAEGDVKTLTTSQITQIANLSEEMGETILKFKKEYDARDRYIQKIIKGYDQIFKELDGTEVKHEDPRPAAKPAPTPQPAATPAAPTATATPAATTPPAAAPTVTPAPAANAASADGDAGDTENMGANKPVEAVDKFIRKMSQTMLGLFKKNMTISGATISLATKSANVYLTYGEKSLAQYGNA